MCIRITERYAVCGCVYYVHGVDQCQSVGQHGHHVQEKVVLVGYACARHAPGSGQVTATSSLGVLPDYVSSSSSGYSGYR